MKKIRNLLLVLVLMISFSSLAFADEAGEDFDDGQESVDETDDSDNMDGETGDEILIMNTSLGAEIRLLQLEKAIVKNILKGEMAISVLQALEFNTTELEAILSELKAVLEDVQAVDTGANDSVALFVELKQDARNVTRQFREAIHALLDDVTLRELRERMQEFVDDELQDYAKRIRNRIRQFNRNQVYRLFGVIGEANISLLNDYLNGNVTLDDLRFYLCKTVNQMNRERRYEVFSMLKEDRIRKRIRAQEEIEELQHHGKGKGNGKNS